MNHFDAHVSVTEMFHSAVQADNEKAGLLTGTDRRPKIGMSHRKWDRCVNFRRGGKCYSVPYED